MTLYKALQTSAREQLRVLVLGIICAAIYAAIVHAAPTLNDLERRGILVTNHHSTNAPGGTCFPSTMIAMGDTFR